ncbi:MAG: PorP/SprF family type IX secretion system membrane protein [Sphingomonadales bacterium]|jgi:type IX secretion system PorP/SprF family membrane protein
MTRIKILAVLLFGGVFDIAHAQDPHFSQYSQAPFTVNPAFTGVFEGNARLMSTYRQQWASLVDPFTTTLVSGDVKLGSYYPGYGQHPFNVGFQVMTDRSMGGAYKSSYAGFTTAYHVPLDAEESNTSMGVGLSLNYGNRRIDYSDISFDQQFTSGGFVLTLPNGETALQAMKPFISVGAGILFRSQDEASGTFVDVGFSGYHFNKPQQTFMNDSTQFLPLRWSGQLSFQKYMSEVSYLQVQALYQNQASVNYLLAGVSFARLFGNENRSQVGGGCWYRTGESFIPHVFVEYSGLRVGVSYDLLHNGLKSNRVPTNAVEFSLQWRVGNLL